MKKKVQKKQKALKFYHAKTDQNARVVENNILSFASEEDFNNTLDSLENAFDNYSLKFLEDNKNLTDEQVNANIESQNIDLEKPLTDFETMNNFSSLRNTLNNKEAQWLSQPNPNFYECPQFHSIISQTERTLWNADGEIMIGGKIFKYDDEDTKYIKIEDGDFDKLALINAGDLEVFSDPNINFITLSAPNSSSATTQTQCTGTAHNLFENTTGIGGLFWTISENRIKPLSWYSSAKHNLSASTKTYIRIQTSGVYYKKYVTLLYAGFTGNKYYGCGQNATQTGGTKERLSSAVSIEHKRNSSFGVRYSTGYCSMQSYHAAGSPNNQILPGTYFKLKN